MYPREEVQPAAKIDNGQPEPQNKGGPSSGSGGGVETAPCSDRVAVLPLADITVAQ